MLRLGQLALLILVGVLSMGCGARSGHVQGDGGWLPPRRDSAPPRDGVVPHDARPRDLPRPVDLFRPDSCLPIPASAVSGFYTGVWNGTNSCPGDPATPLSGTLSFELLPAGSTSFSVRGKMNGIIQRGGPGGPGVPFFATIDGAMGCTALSAKLEVNVLGAATYQGTIAATFAATPSRGFPSGSWQVENVNGASCKTAGIWKAAQ